MASVENTNGTLYMRNSLFSFINLICVECECDYLCSAIDIKNMQNIVNDLTRLLTQPIHSHE